MATNKAISKFLGLTLAACSVFGNRIISASDKKVSSHSDAASEAAAPSIRFDRKYDKFKDRTSFRAGLLKLKPDDVDVLVGAECKGDLQVCRLDANDSIYFSLYYTLGSAELDNTPVYLIIDGEHEGDNLTGIGLGEVTFDGYAKKGIRHNLFMTIPASLLVKMSNAKSVEGQVAGQEFTMQTSHTETLKKLAHALGLL